MKLSLGWIAAAALAFSMSAQAHTHLKQATPADGSVVNAAPSNIVLEFTQPARVTAITLQKDGGAEQKLEPLPAQAAKEISVPAGKLAPGQYVVNWRVISADNHIMSGKLHFTIDPKATPSAGKPAASEHKH